jgi:hypothetical protein
MFMHCAEWLEQGRRSHGYRCPGFDFNPLTALPEIEPAGRISGEGV